MDNDSRPINPWDSLMACGLSWEEAQLIVRAYAEWKGIKVPQFRPPGSLRRSEGRAESCSAFHLVKRRG